MVYVYYITQCFKLNTNFNLKDKITIQQNKPNVIP